MSERESRTVLSEELGARLEAYRAGELDETEQKAFEQEILRRPELARALYESEGVDVALRAGASSVRAGRRPPMRILIPLAAVALVVLAFLPRLGKDSTPEPAPAFRGPETRLEAQSPRGDVGGETVDFVWSDYEGAIGYRLEVFDVNSQLVLERRTADTNIEVPAGEMAALVGAGGFWRVSALGELGSILATSSPAPLRLR